MLDIGFDDAPVEEPVLLWDERTEELTIELPLLDKLLICLYCFNKEEVDKEFDVLFLSLSILVSTTLGDFSIFNLFNSDKLPITKFGTGLAENFLILLSFLIIAYELFSLRDSFFVFLTGPDGVFADSKASLAYEKSLKTYCVDSSRKHFSYLSFVSLPILSNCSQYFLSKLSPTYVITLYTLGI